jgi:hypothetical protein
MKQIRDDIYAELAPLFPGFQLDKNEEGFVRATATGNQKLLVPFVDRHPRYKFSLLCCVRLNEVEDICNRFNPAPHEYHSMTVTSTTPLSYFGGAGEYNFTSIRELKEATADLAALSKDILLFMDRHQDKFAVYEAMKTDGARFDNSVGVGRAMRVVTLARLCGDVDFRAVVAEQDAAASGWHEEDRQTFHALVAYLARPGKAS